MQNENFSVPAAVNTNGMLVAAVSEVIPTVHGRRQKGGEGTG
jgi:hypothetical protein